MLSIARVIVFVDDVAAMTAFYELVIGLRVREVSPDGRWAELDGGGCGLALHAKGPHAPTGGGSGKTKVVFGARDVAAARAELVRRGASMGDVMTSPEVVLCNGTDPEGNAFQLSNRGL